MGDREEERKRGKESTQGHQQGEETMERSARRNTAVCIYKINKPPAAVLSELKLLSTLLRRTAPSPILSMLGRFAINVKTCENNNRCSRNGKGWEGTSAESRILKRSSNTISSHVCTRLEHQRVHTNAVRLNLLRSLTCT